MDFALSANTTVDTRTTSLSRYWLEMSELEMRPKNTSKTKRVLFFS